MLWRPCERNSKFSRLQPIAVAHSNSVLQDISTLSGPGPGASAKIDQLRLLLLRQISTDRGVLHKHRPNRDRIDKFCKLKVGKMGSGERLISEVRGWTGAAISELNRKIDEKFHRVREIENC
ncbi:hypothetical protein MTP99_010081 [Tenebrio molitor]|nr:hypothetical protein MTP99_010081 [Tenebrio molitor]